MSTILITGANRGIGLEFAKQFHAEGWKVWATSRSISNAGELIGIISYENVIELDVSQSDQVIAMENQLREQNVKLHCLINNAGVMTDRVGIDKVSQDDMVQAFKVNSASPVMLVQTLLPMLKSGCKIVNISSREGQEIIHQLNFVVHGQGGLLDIIHKDNNIWISYTEDRGGYKTSTSIARAEFNKKKLNFKNILIEFNFGI